MSSNVFWLVCVVLLLVGLSPARGQSGIQDAASELAVLAYQKLKNLPDQGETRVFPGLFFEGDTTKTQLGLKLGRAFRDKLQFYISKKAKPGRFKIVTDPKEEQYLTEQAYRYHIVPSNQAEDEQLRQRLNGLNPHFFITAKYQLQQDRLLITSLLFTPNDYLKSGSSTALEVINEPYKFRIDPSEINQWMELNSALATANSAKSSQFFDFVFGKHHSSLQINDGTITLGMLVQDNEGKGDFRQNTTALRRLHKYKLEVKLTHLAKFSHLYILQLEKKLHANNVDVYPLYPIKDGDDNPINAPRRLLLPDNSDAATSAAFELDQSTPSGIHFVLIATSKPIPFGNTPKDIGDDGSYTPLMLEETCAKLLNHLRQLKPTEFLLLYKEVSVGN